MNHLVKAAFQYREWGLSIVPVSKKKFPYFEWHKFQSDFMSSHEILQYFSMPWVHGIAVVCGKISGNLECIDMDCKYDLSHFLSWEFSNACLDNCPELFSELIINATKNNGHHFIYRSAGELESNIALARRPATAEELIQHPKQLFKVLLETRSNGGIIVAPPTPGYRFLQHDLGAVPTIQPADRDLLFTIARSFNSYEEPKQFYPKNVRIVCPKESDPFFSYDQSDEIIGLLQIHGWIKVRRRGQRTYFRRPGDTDKDTSGNYHHGLKLFKTFSTNTEFVAGKAYMPHTIFAILECGRDFKLAAKRLLAYGFGFSYVKRHQRTVS